MNKIKLLFSQLLCFFGFHDWEVAYKSKARIKRGYVYSGIMKPHNVAGAIGDYCKYECSRPHCRVYKETMTLCGHEIDM